MCRTVTCRRCDGTTWAGCGQHVDRVMAGVPADRRCHCKDSPPTDAPGARAGWLARLLRR